MRLLLSFSASILRKKDNGVLPFPMSWSGWTRPIKSNASTADTFPFRIASIVLEIPWSSRRPIPSPRGKESGSSKTQSSADYVDLLPEDGEDPLMAVSFLLEDAHEIRQHIQRLWRRYQNLEIDLITATVVTQEAFYHV